MQYLVMTHDIGWIDWASKKQMLEDEAQSVWQLVSAGKLRNIWFTGENKDAVLLFEEEAEDKVKAIMDGLLLVAHGLIAYQIHELTPYTGFERLFYGTDR
jgi:hypothetical protein